MLTMLSAHPMTRFWLYGELARVFGPDHGRAGAGHAAVRSLLADGLIEPHPGRGRDILALTTYGREACETVAPLAAAARARRATGQQLVPARGLDPRRPLLAAIRPVVRAWIRYFPLDVGKRRVWTSIVEPYLLWTHHRFVVRCRNGARMAGDTVEVHQQFLYFFGIHEPNLTGWMRRQLRGGDVLVDVGAHIGYYTLLGSRLVGTRGGVIAVEPSPRALHALNANVNRNGAMNVRVIHAAAGARRETVTIYRTPEMNQGLANLRPDPDVSTVPEAEVAAAPLFDMLTPTEVARVRVVKVDAEGAEGDVVEGMRPLLASGRRDLEVVVEVSPDRLTARGGSPARLFEVFERYGFNAYHLPNNDYDPFGHLRRARGDRPRRIDGPIAVEGDIVFSRLDRDFL